MIAASVVTLTQLLKQTCLIPDGWGLIGAALLSALGVGLWAVSQPNLPQRTDAWPLFAGWVVVLAAASGTYEVARRVRLKTLPPREPTAVAISTMPEMRSTLGWDPRATTPPEPPRE